MSSTDAFLVIKPAEEVFLRAPILARSMVHCLGSGVNFGISQYALLKTMEELIENGIYKHRLIGTKKLISRFVCPCGVSSGKRIRRFNDASTWSCEKSIVSQTTLYSKQIMTVMTLFQIIDCFFFLSYTDRK